MLRDEIHKISSSLSFRWFDYRRGMCSRTSARLLYLHVVRAAIAMRAGEKRAQARGGSGREYKSGQRRETGINLRFRTKTFAGSVCTESVRQTQWPNANDGQRTFALFVRPSVFFLPFVPFFLRPCRRCPLPLLAHLSGSTSADIISSRLSLLSFASVRRG